MKMEAQRSSKALANSYKTKWRHNSEPFFIGAAVRSDHIIADRVISFAKTCSRIMFLPLWTYHAILEVLFRLQGWTNPMCGVAVVTKNVVLCRPIFVGHQHEICCMSPFRRLQFWRSCYTKSLCTLALHALSEVSWICKVFNMNGNSESEKSGRTEIRQEKSTHSFVAYLA